MSTELTDKPVMEDPLAQLEKAFIAEYLRSRGYDPEKLHELPEEVVKQLMTEASLYASTKLEEVEARAHFVEEVHGTASHKVE
jgi:hypothetical protein